VAPPTKATSEDMAATLRERLARLLGLEGKASRTAKLIAWTAGGQPVWTPRDLASLARQGFAKNAVVYRAVRMIAEAAASVPLYLFDGEEEIDEHPLLALLAKPNAAHCAPDLFEAWYGHLLVAGNSYMEAVTVAGSLRELHMLRPDRMKVVPGADGWPEAYDYTVGGQTVRFRQDEAGGVRPILHMALFHPLNDYYGMSPLEARPLPSTSTTRPARGTRRCSTIPPVRRARSSTARRTGSSRRSSSSG
jgi:phage portal protein BeeE